MRAPVGSFPARLLQPFDPQPDRLLATLELANRDLAGALPRGAREIKPKRKEDYPSELTSQMEHREAQFFLRNIPRLERFPEEELPFDRRSIALGSLHDALEAVRGARYEPPVLVEVFNLAHVKAYRRGIRRAFYEDDWTRRFGRELREKLRVPVWRYDADAPPEVREEQYK